MSTPHKSRPNAGTRDVLLCAINEVISAMSALNMPPQPVVAPKGEFLSETDAWAAHAMEHLRNACSELRNLDTRIGTAVDVVRQANQAGEASNATFSRMLDWLTGE